MTGRFKTVTIGTESYQLPLSGANAPWGEELSDLIEGLVDAINIVQGPQDIQETSATILNTSGAKNITGLAFNPASVRSVDISYNISRKITKTISAIPTGTGVIQVDIATAHDLFTGDQITIAGSNSTPSIDGTYTVTKVDADSISIDIGATVVTVAGTTGTFQIELIESGTLSLNYSLNGWKMTEYGVNGDAQVEIDFNASGQGTYTPTVLTGSSHIGLMTFIAKALLST